MKRLLLILAAASLTIAQAATAAAPTCKAHEAKGPCETESFVYARVEKGCEEKGRKGAASAMRMMMLRANQKRADLTCDSCHVEPHEQKYVLTDDAHDLAAKWFEGETKAKKK